MSVSGLRRVLDEAYSPGDYPALEHQTHQWSVTKPFEGVRLLDVTPVFANTLAKYLPLLAGGAELTVALSPLLPNDPEIARVLAGRGVPVTSSPRGTYDVVMDCAGVFSTVGCHVGFVELTKTGEHVYQHCDKPVFLVDDSRTKHIETSLGTGDGFVRALAHFGHGDLAGRTIVVFGAGKVGRGAALRAVQAGAEVIVVDPDAAPVPGCRQASAQADVEAAIAGAWCVVTATGVAGALGPLTEQLRESSALLANLGAEDEFGPDMPAHRVLNGKLPVNFALTEPTRLRYLDATMALVNACALALLAGGSQAGLNRPPRAVEDEILEITRRSRIGAELAAIEEELR